MIKTASFKLAAYEQGDAAAPKLALVLPGLLDTKDYPHMRSHVDYLAQRGYYAISFDPPGSWGSDGNLADYTMTNYLKAIDELIAQYGNKPTLLVGHSLGCLMAELVASRNVHIAAFVAIMSPPSVVRTVDGEEHAIGWPLAKLRELGVRPSERDLPDDPAKSRRFALPYSFVEDARRYNSLDELSQVYAPKLFIPGAYDTKIRPELMRATYDAAAGPKRFVTLESDHDYRRHPELIKKVDEIIGRFLDGLPKI